MIRIGVLGTSGIAERRMIPAIGKEPGLAYAGVAASTMAEMGFAGTEAEFAPVLAAKKEKAARFREKFGGTVRMSYEEMLADPAVDAVYIALPPALHEKWIGAAIRSGKHVLAEKPFTTREESARALVREARERKVALIENYGFCGHGQMRLIRELTEGGAVGELRLVRASFGFPHRESTDFRYNRALGGGALLDCGGYTVRAATAVLGPELEAVSASAVTPEGYEVDLSGCATLRRPDGICAQLAWGMDHAYRCELEIWGSAGILTAPRIFTAPDGFAAPVILKRGQQTEERTVSDDQFLGIASRFAECVRSETARNEAMEEILLQSRLTERIRGLCAAGEARGKPSRRE